jgi:AcrR family transcriptional regulator
VARHIRRQQRESEILSAAREVFLAKGFERSSVSEIAARVGVVEGLVFRYFPTKRELLDEVMRALYEPLIADVGNGFARISGLRERLRFIVWRHVRVYAETPGLARLVLHEVRTGPEYEGSVLHELHVRYTGFLHQTIQQAITDGELDAEADYEPIRSLVYGGLEHLMWPVLCGYRQIDIEGVTDSFTEYVLRGLGFASPRNPDVETRLVRLEHLLGGSARHASARKLKS